MDLKANPVYTSLHLALIGLIFSGGPEIGSGMESIGDWLRHGEISSRFRFLFRLWAKNNNKKRQKQG